MDDLVQLRRRGQNMTDDERKQAQKAFLESFRMNANIRLAALKAGVHRSLIYVWLEKDPEFSIEYHEAEKDANDVIRATIYQRAIYGVEEPITSMGRVLYDENGKMLTTKKYSDALLMRLASARMPEFRNEQKVEHSGSIDVSAAKDTLLQKLAARIAQES